MQQFLKSSGCPTQHQRALCIMLWKTSRSKKEARDTSSHGVPMWYATSKNFFSIPTHSKSQENLHQSVSSILTGLWKNMSRYGGDKFSSFLYYSMPMKIYEFSLFHLELARGYALACCWPSAASSSSSLCWCRISSLKWTQKSQDLIQRTASW